MNFGTISTERTTMACPEQHIFFLTNDPDQKEIGYARLRHGSFSFSLCIEDDTKMTRIFQEHIDGGDGCFGDDEQRFSYLNRCANILKNIYNLQ